MMDKVEFSSRRGARLAALRAAGFAACIAAVPIGVFWLCWQAGFAVSETSFALIAVAVIGVGAIIGALLSTQRRMYRLLRGFDLICEQSLDPFFLTDIECNLIRANPTACAAYEEGRRASADDHDIDEHDLLPNTDLARGLALADVLSAWTERADEMVYRLARKASATWGEPEWTAGPIKRSISVRRLREGVLMWRVSTPTSFANLDDADASFPVFRLTADGVLQGHNPQFAHLAADVQAALVEETSKAIDDGAASAVVTAPDGASFTLAIAATKAGEANVFAIARNVSRGELLGRLLENLPVALARMDADGAIISVNAAARKLLGDGAEKGVALEKLVEGFGRPIAAQVRDAAAGRGAGRTEQGRGRVEGREVFLQIALTRAPDDERGELLAVLSDATELKTLEQQFVQSQKMQAVGQMAGGVAHDFNNLLTAIIGHCDLLMLRTDHAQPAFADLTQIKQNANRAAGLVRQLLAFSRKQTLKPKPASLSDTLNELSHLLNRLLGEKVVIELEHAFDLWPVWIDERQFEQVIVNLAVNARDAMPEGGTVKVRSWNRVLTKAWNRDRAVVQPGDYVCIKVTDTGAGMDEDTMNKVFEPFFTTKRQGEGTGLGLSTAYGIVKQMDGFIFVDSAPGEGTVFTILLPRMVNAPPIEVAAPAPVAGDLTGSGAILLVEDEAPVRTFAARALKMRGYDVLEADCAEAALTILADESVAIDLMISDVVMPGLDGPTWVRTARQTRPDVGVIFISGYAEGVFRNETEDIKNSTFLAKPFVLDELAAAVKKVLEGNAKEKDSVD